MHNAKTNNKIVSMIRWIFYAQSNFPWLVLSFCKSLAESHNPLRVNKYVCNSISHIKENYSNSEERDF